MLVLSMYAHDEKVVMTTPIGDITLSIVSVEAGSKRVKVGLTAPYEVRISRVKRVLDQVQQEVVT